MGRTKSAINKQIVQPEVTKLQDNERLAIIADVLLEIIFEENQSAAA